MKNLIIKSTLTTSFFLLITLIIVYNAIYNPLYQALEETSLENFINITETSKVTFENIIQRGLENSKSISSRTMIKRKIIEYKHKMIDLAELKRYTQPKYRDGIEVLDNLVYSARIVDQNIIASHGESPVPIKSIDEIDDFIYEIFENNNTMYLLVYSPIKSKMVIGMDVLLFGYSNIIPNMESYGMSINIATAEEKMQTQGKLMSNPLISQYTDDSGLVYLNVFYDLEDDMFLHISIPKDTFYYDFDKITKSSFRNLMLVFILGFVFINGLVIIFASQKITSLDKSNEKHKKNSYYDALTGAYSRSYLNQWLHDNSENQLNYSIVFLDMNNFKGINDQYGHHVGDQVLKEVVSIFKSDLRENDCVIRFGGDEFIILLDGVSKEMTKKIIQRINKKLELLTSIDIKVSFSYGIDQLTSTAEFYDVLEKIDGQMYEMKERC